MPELPDITVYCEALEKRLLGQPLMAIRFMNPFVLRTVEPSDTPCRACADWESAS